MDVIRVLLNNQDTTSAQSAMYVRDTLAALLTFLEQRNAPHATIISRTENPKVASPIANTEYRALPSNDSLGERLHTSAYFSFRACS